MKIGEFIDSLSSLQVFTIILAFGLLIVGIGANGYQETEDRANVLCLSCLGLDPKTTLEFRFDTANGEEHPDFVTKPLENKPVFLDYSSDGCAACDAMRPKIKELEDEYGDKITFVEEINLDHTSTEKKESYELYDYKEQRAVPLFVIITLGYDDGIVKPYYTAGYGFLNEKGEDDAKEVLVYLFNEAVEIYEQNKG